MIPLAFSQLAGVAKTLTSIQKFVEGELILILSTIADVEYKAAAQAMQNVSMAKDKRQQVFLAVGHLQSAHTALKGLHSGKGWRGYFTFTTRQVALQKDIFTLSLMAVCYSYLKETELMRDTLQTARASMELLRVFHSVTLGELSDPEKRKIVISIAGTWLNPGSWPAIGKAGWQIARNGAADGFPEITPEVQAEFDQFAAALERTPSRR